MVLAGLIGVASPAAARADNGSDPGTDAGDLTVTVVDPSASASPSPSGSSGSGSNPGHGGSGAGSGGGSGSESGSGSGSGSHGGSKIPRWIVLGGFGGHSHSEFNPFRGWVRSTVTLMNHSATDTAKGRLEFRLLSFLGGQLGPTVTREITGLRPGQSVTRSADLVGVGQWPLVQVSVSFQQEGVGDIKPMVRESWVLGSPWLLIVFVIATLAGLIIARIRRGAPVPVLQPEAAV